MVNNFFMYFFFADRFSKKMYDCFAKCYTLWNFIQRQKKEENLFFVSSQNARTKDRLFYLLYNDELQILVIKVPNYNLPPQNKLLN